MSRPVKIVLVLVLLLGGLDATRDYFTAANEPGSAKRFGENLSFWIFVAFAICLAAYGIYRRFRAGK